MTAYRKRSKNNKDIQFYLEQMTIQERWLFCNPKAH